MATIQLKVLIVFLAEQGEKFIVLMDGAEIKSLVILAQILT